MSEIELQPLTRGELFEIARLIDEDRERIRADMEKNPESFDNADRQARINWLNILTQKVTAQIP